MNKILLMTFLVFVGINGYAQITFEKGYLIDNNENKIDCFIKNIDRESNPVEFSYKLSENGAVKKGNLDSVKEFGIENSFKYQRFMVSIDRSTDNINSLNTNKNSDFNTEQLFLKTLVEGKATLFYYQDKSLKRYFFNVEEGKTTQLEYKKYKTKNDEVAENVNFRQQLWNGLICTSIKVSEIEEINYRKKELVDFFIRYNVCSETTYINYDFKEKGSLFNLSIRPGLNFSSLEIKNTSSSSRDTDFEKESSIRIGVEMEFVLPFKKGKWSVLLEPTYQSYKSEKELFYIPTNSTNVMVDYKSLEFPIGVRYNIFLNKTSKIFVNYSYVIAFSINSSLYAERQDILDLEIKARPSAAFGIGYNFKNKLGIEIRYGLSREILSNYMTWNSDFKTLSYIISYNLLGS